MPAARTGAERPDGLPAKPPPTHNAATATKTTSPNSPTSRAGPATPLRAWAAGDGGSERGSIRGGTTRVGNSGFGNHWRRLGRFHWRDLAGATDSTDPAAGARRRGTRRPGARRVISTSDSASSSGSNGSCSAAVVRDSVCLRDSKRVGRSSSVDPEPAAMSGIGIRESPVRRRRLPAPTTRSTRNRRPPAPGALSVPDRPACHRPPAARRRRSFLDIQFQRPDEGHGGGFIQALAAHRQAVGHVFQLERQIGMDDELSGRVAVPGFFGLQPALRPRQPSRNPDGWRQTVAAQGEFKVSSVRGNPSRVTIAPQRAGRIFRNAGLKGWTSSSSRESGARRHCKPGAPPLSNHCRPERASW